MEVEQLKLLKGRFNPKTLVAAKRGRAVTESDILFRIDAELFHCSSISRDVRCRFRGLRRPQPHQSALCYCCHPPPRARPTPSCIAPC